MLTRDHGSIHHRINRPPRTSVRVDESDVRRPCLPPDENMIINPLTTWAIFDNKYWSFIGTISSWRHQRL